MHVCLHNAVMQLPMYKHNVVMQMELCSEATYGAHMLLFFCILQC